MDELVRLPGDCLDDRRRRMADREHPDAAGKIDERVAVDVEDQLAVRALHHHVGGAAETGRSGRLTPREQIAGARTRNLRVQPDV